MSSRPLPSHTRYTFLSTRAHKNHLPQEFLNGARQNIKREGVQDLGFPVLLAEVLKHHAFLSTIDHWEMQAWLAKEKKPARKGEESDLNLKRKLHACKSLQKVKAGYPWQKRWGSSLEILFQQLVEHLISNTNIRQAIRSPREKLLISPTQATQATGCSQWRT